MSSGSQGWVNQAPIQPCDVLQYSIWLVRVGISHERDNREAFFKKIEGLLMFICPEKLCKLFGQINNWSCYSTEARQKLSIITECTDHCSAFFYRCLGWLVLYALNSVKIWLNPSFRYDKTKVGCFLLEKRTFLQFKFKVLRTHYVTFCVIYCLKVNICSGIFKTSRNDALLYI